MTEKRFTVEKFTELEYGIKQDGETLIGLSLDKITAKYIVKQWNELAEENEQLKQFKEYVFDLIDKEIKETKEIFEDGKIDLMMYNASMITLIGLKEQLKGDLE